MLDRHRFVATFLFDTSVARYEWGSLGGTGTATFRPSPSLGATIRINGKTFSIAGGYAGQISTGGGLTVFDARDYSTGPNLTTYNALYFNLWFIPLSSITAPFDDDLHSDGNLTGLISIQTRDAIGYSINTWSTMVPEHLTITSIGAVPEPSTWAMMLLGFAGLGFAFRQSRRKLSVA